MMADIFIKVELLDFVHHYYRPTVIMVYQILQEKRLIYLVYQVSNIIILDYVALDTRNYCNLCDKNCLVCNRDTNSCN